MNYKITILAFTFLALMSSSCSWNVNDCKSGNGNEEERTLDMPNDISEIELNIECDLILTQGNTQEIVVIGDANLIDLIITDSRRDGDKWEIDIDGCSDSDGLTIKAQLKSIEALIISGSGTIISNNRFNCDEDLLVKIEGSGKIELDINSSKDVNSMIEGSGKIELSIDNAKDVNAKIEGSGDIILTGSSSTYEKSNLAIEGSGEIKTKTLCGIESIVSIQGSGKIEVCVSDKLDVDIEGSGEVCHIGGASVTTEIDGSGKVKECD